MSDDESEQLNIAQPNLGAEPFQRSLDRAEREISERNNNNLHEVIFENDNEDGHEEINGGDHQNENRQNGDHQHQNGNRQNAARRNAASRNEVRQNDRNNNENNSNGRNIRRRIEEVEIEDGENNIPPQNVYFDREEEAELGTDESDTEPMDMDHLDISDISMVPKMRGLSRVTINDLMKDEETESINFDGYLDVMFLRVIASGYDKQTNYNVKQYRKGNKSTAHETPYTRLMMFKVMNPRECHKLIYVMEAENQNKRLWSHNTALRDNGSITIGRVLRMVKPQPIDNILRDGVPSNVTTEAFVPMKDPDPINMVQIPIKTNIQGDDLEAFSLNKCTVRVVDSTPEETGCAGFFCDKQRIHEAKLYRQGCGCYCWSDRKNNMVLDHKLRIYHKESGTKIYCSSYTSIRFSSLYQNRPFSASVRRRELDRTTQFFELKKCVDDCIQLINNNGGFTVVGWYKRGMVNDRVILSATEGADERVKRMFSTEVTQVDSGKLHIHPCLITPSNTTFSNKASVLRSRLDSMKFDTSNLGNFYAEE